MRYREIPWHLGNCIGTDPEVWFPEGKNGWREDTGVERICQQCEIKTQCLEWALDNGEFGWWGGRYFSNHGGMQGSRNGDAGEVQPGGDGSRVPEVRCEAASEVCTVER